jgi:hypothetical protein
MRRRFSRMFAVAIGGNRRLLVIGAKREDHD